MDRIRSVINDNYELKLENKKLKIALGIGQYARKTKDQQKGKPKVMSEKVVTIRSRVKNTLKESHIIATPSPRKVKKVGARPF
jgi:regulator of replication initiation timing